MNEKMKKIAEKLPKEVIAALAKCVSTEELEKVIKESGVQLSEEERNTLKEALEQSAVSLSDTDLEQAAGGIIYF